MVNRVVLIVDDNKNYVDRLIDLMEDSSIANPVIVANNYNEATRLIAKEKPGIVLLDMNMPGKSGIEVLRYIKE
ncbi:MAG: response regulator, partial [Bacteroidota bacterium]